MTDLTLNPTSLERIPRIKGRIERLRQAIALESEKKEPDSNRLESLQTELQEKIAVVKQLRKDLNEAIGDGDGNV